MTKPQPESFGEMIRKKRAAEAALSVRPDVMVVSTRPAATQSRIVILKRCEDGTILEKSARPSFLFKDPQSYGDKYILPKGYYWRGSPDHLARRAELEKERGA